MYTVGSIVSIIEVCSQTSPHPSPPLPSPPITGSHELLYQEFLPLLSSLLQGLNRLQSGIHKQYMKDLFVELCLTVPVRLSSLLPYLHMLMDPLVSALNGSQTLVSQVWEGMSTGVVPCHLVLWVYSEATHVLSVGDF